MNTGPVRIIHGDRDGIVPMSCSERFAETYREASELIVVEGIFKTKTKTD